jgi:hypothetical protein
LSAGYHFPLERTNDRALPPDYAGPIDVWDIDKTYLESEFESFRDLVGRAIELAVDKRTRPGVAPLLRALRRGPAPHDLLAFRAPLYFVSASPPQLRRTLERKMLLDGVEWDGISFKDHLSLMRARRFSEVRRHVAYKLTALLEYRREWPAGAREWLYGDDAETDPLVYSLFADIRAGTLASGRLDHALARYKVSGDDRHAIHALAEETPRGDIGGIFIFRVAATPKFDLAEFPRVTGVSSAVECAARLVAAGRIAAEALEEVKRESEV